MVVQFLHCVIKLDFGALFFLSICCC